MAYQFTQTAAQIQALLDYVETLVPVVLFTGDATGDVTLSQSAANYSKLKIYYDGYNGRSPQCLELTAPNGRTIDLSIVEPNGGGQVRIRIARYTISGTSITLKTGENWNGNILLTPSGNTWADGNVIHVTRVEGFI